MSVQQCRGMEIFLKELYFHKFTSKCGWIYLKSKEKRQLLNSLFDFADIDVHTKLWSPGLTWFMLQTRRKIKEMSKSFVSVSNSTMTRLVSLLQTASSGNIVTIQVKVQSPKSKFSQKTLLTQNKWFELIQTLGIQLKILFSLEILIRIVTKSSPSFKTAGLEECFRVNCGDGWCQI